MTEGMARPWLMLSCCIPREHGVGVELRAWAHLSALASHSRPRLLLFLTPAQLAQPMDLAPLREIADVHVLTLVPTARGRRLGNTWALLSQRVLLWGRSPWNITRESLELLHQFLGGSPLQGVFCFRLICFDIWRMQRRHGGLSVQRLLVDFDDIESLATERALQIDARSRGRAHAIADRLAMLECRRLESVALREAEVLVCSTVDRLRLLQRVPHARVHVIPNAYPVLPVLAPKERHDVLNLLFLGTLSYPPNIDGVEHAADQILPAVQRLWGGLVRLRVVGRRPAPRVLAKHRPPDLQVVGEVDDVTQAYAEADIVIVPIRFGSGTRIKILEALSLGRPVVTTTAGVEGLDLEHGRDLLVADTPDDFAIACLRIARDETLRTSLITRGREAFLSHYSADVVRRRLAALLDNQ